MVEFYDPIAGKNISYHIAPVLLRQWNNLREGGLAKLNEDRHYLVDGREGTGKSSFAFQQAKYIDPTFNVNQICFTPKDFLNLLRNSEKGKVIVFDEAFRGLSSKGSRSKVNKEIIEALMEVRQRNLIVFIVLPTIFLLEIYAAVFRSEALLHVYKLKKKLANGQRVRGVRVYNYENKKLLYLRGKTKYFSYSFPRIGKAKGEFYVKRNEQYPQGIPYETFELEEYLKKKEEAFRKKEGSEEMGLRDKKNDMLATRLIEMIVKINNNNQMAAAKQLEEYNIPLTNAAISMRLKKLRESVENEA